LGFEKYYMLIMLIAVLTSYYYFFSEKLVEADCVCESPVKYTYINGLRPDTGQR
jgi:hypothetical protein